MKAYLLCSTTPAASPLAHNFLLSHPKLILHADQVRADGVQIIAMANLPDHEGDREQALKQLGQIPGITKITVAACL